MNLNDYLKKYGITITAFAKRIGRGRSWIHRFINGEISPTVSMAEKIEKMTEGKVSKEEILCIKHTKRTDGNDREKVNLVFYEKRLQNFKEETKLFEQAIKLSRQDGMEEEKKNIAKRMREEGYDDSTIEKLTLLSNEEMGRLEG